jgi:hypothetical protein
MLTGLFDRIYPTVIPLALPREASVPVLPVRLALAPGLPVARRPRPGLPAQVLVLLAQALVLQERVLARLAQQEPEQLEQPPHRAWPESSRAVRQPERWGTEAANQPSLRR